MEQFMGTWKLTASENFDEYMKAVGKTFFYLLLHTKINRWGFSPFSTIITYLSI